MKRGVGRTMPFLACAIFAAGCGSDSSSRNDAGTPASGTPCNTSGATFCVDNGLMVCVDGAWRKNQCTADQTCRMMPQLPGAAPVFACISTAIPTGQDAAGAHTDNPLPPNSSTGGSSGGGTTTGGSDAIPSAGDRCTMAGFTHCTQNDLLTCIDGTWHKTTCAPGQTCRIVSSPVADETVFGCAPTLPPTPGSGGTGTGTGGGSGSGSGTGSGSGSGTGGGTVPSGAQNEFAACTSNAMCTGGLMCDENIQICVKPCQRNAAQSACAATQVCVPNSATDPNAGACLNHSAGRDEACGYNGNICQDNTLSCTQVDTRQYGCKLTCDASAIGQRGTCPSGEMCLEVPDILDAQYPITACTTVGSSSECNGAAGYTCREVQSGAKYCGRTTAWCGSIAPILGQLTTPAIQQYISDGSHCNMSTGHVGCAVYGATAAPADTYCLPVTQDESQGVCVARCDGGVGRPDLDCGLGYRCARPPIEEAGFMDLQYNSAGVRIPCSPTGAQVCQTSEGYTCNMMASGSSGASSYFCSRPSKMCLNATP